MPTIPPFNADGFLPPGDHEASFDELRSSILALGPTTEKRSTWDAQWRLRLIENLEILARQLWQVGIGDIFGDGSFAEDKDHPNDIDGYFVCSLDELKSGELTRKLNLLDPYKIWTWDPSFPKALSRLSEEAAPHVASVSGGTLPARTRPRIRQRHSGQVRA